ncbi:MAG TPA: STAS domain-containing protein [Herpetosiphonaceae bacterium]
MTAHPRLADLMRERRSQFCATLAESAKNGGSTIYSSMSDAGRTQMAELVADNVTLHFTGEQPIERFAERMIAQRVKDPNYTPEAVQIIINAIDQALTELVDGAFPEPSAERDAAIVAAKDLVMRDLSACYINYTRSREQALRDSLEEQSHLVAMVRELSSPIIPVHDSILVLPLVGSIDAQRAQMIMEDLLTAIVDRQAELVIIDITGVPLVDTAIANYLVQTTKAVNLLGAQTVLVGIGADVAQTLVGLEIDLRQMTVRANLQDGIAHALAALGLSIQPFAGAAA